LSYYSFSLNYFNSQKLEKKRQSRLDNLDTLTTLAFKTHGKNEQEKQYHNNAESLKDEQNRGINCWSLIKRRNHLTFSTSSLYQACNDGGSLIKRRNYLIFSTSSLYPCFAHPLSFLRCYDIVFLVRFCHVSDIQRR
jgi:hypothetical protein